jgi:hypothetical protein
LQSGILAWEALDMRVRMYAGTVKTRDKDIRACILFPLCGIAGESYFFIISGKKRALFLNWEGPFFLFIYLLHILTLQE